MVPVGRSGVVRYAHRTPGSSSTHFPMAYSNIFFSATSEVLFVVSTCPLL